MIRNNFVSFTNILRQAVKNSPRPFLMGLQASERQLVVKLNKNTRALAAASSDLRTSNFYILFVEA